MIRCKICGRRRERPYTFDGRREKRGQLVLGFVRDL